MIKKIKNIAKKFILNYIRFNEKTYSQAGEDAIINFLINDKKIKNITYLEIGTNDPKASNNTYLFYLKGHRGVCIEADKTLINDIEKIRPGDKILNIGISTTNEGFADFYIFDCKGLNTFDKHEANNRISSGNYKLIQVDQVAIRSINSIIKENFQNVPDYLSIDAEGLDLSILKSIDFSIYPIPIICAETCVFSENHIRAKDHSISDFLFTKGYFAYADTYINTIFVNKIWFEKP